jgi:hypothetical protein
LSRHESRLLHFCGHGAQRDISQQVLLARQGLPPEARQAD